MTQLRYARGAVEDLRSYLAANLNGRIDTISTEEGYNPALAHPDVYRGAPHPFAVEALAVEVWEERFTAEEQNNRYWYHSCVVTFVKRVPDADVVSAEQMLRSYVSALHQLLMSDPTMGNLDVDARIDETQFDRVGSDGQLVLEASTRITVKREEP